MSRIVIIVSGLDPLRKGDVIEASAALVTAPGSNARAITAGGITPTRDQLGEQSAASNSTG
jgi:hypothetical protein